MSQIEFGFGIDKVVVPKINKTIVGGANVKASIYSNDESPVFVKDAPAMAGLLVWKKNGEWVGSSKGEDALSVVSTAKVGEIGFVISSVPTTYVAAAEGQSEHNAAVCGIMTNGYVNKKALLEVFPKYASLVNDAEVVANFGKLGIYFIEEGVVNPVEE